MYLREKNNHPTIRQNTVIKQFCQHYFKFSLMLICGPVYTCLTSKSKKGERNPGNYHSVCQIIISHIKLLKGAWNTKSLQVPAFPQIPIHCLTGSAGCVEKAARPSPTHGRTQSHMPPHKQLLPTSQWLPGTVLYHQQPEKCLCRTSPQPFQVTSMGLSLPPAFSLPSHSSLDLPSLNTLPSTAPGPVACPQ